MSEQQSIAEFLTQRFAELEAKAKEAPPTSWRLVEVKGTRGALFSAIDVRAYVLADIASKRRLLEMHQMDCWVGAGPDGDDEYFCEGCPSGSVHSSFPNEVVCPTHRLLAAPFASHDDYDQSWRLP